LVATVCTQDGVPIGITLPTRFDEIPDAMDNAVARLRQALRDGGKPDEIAFQWVRGSVSIGRSLAVLDFAHRHGVGFDLTPVNRDAIESRLAAYDDRFPYRALAFDLRLPSHAAQKDAVIEVPRWPGRSLDTRMANGEAAGLSAIFDAEFELGRKRLARVLDRLGQKQFELQVNLDATQIEYWPHYFVHNWSPPAPAWLRMFEFDAGDMFSRASPLLRVGGSGHLDGRDARLLGGAQFFAAAAKAAAMHVESSESLRQAQIEAHAYLRDRVEITADAERLITWMPQTLGATLELGSGLGVMARRIRDRATSYIGLDLTVEQVSVLRELGAGGLVADMQALPFGEGVFDTLVADNVIEHAADPVQALAECARVLKPGGQAFMVIPPDYLRPEFSNQAHLWKADEASVREALTRAGLRIVRDETLHMADLGISGAHPSSDGKTILWQVEKLVTNASPRSQRVGKKAK
jgi:SAM-dependent methyltransferase